VVTVVGLVLGACSSAAPSAPTDAAAPSGTLTVFAAASLTRAFQATAVDLHRSDPGLSITYSFAGSQEFVPQIEQGAPADVVATADTATMDELVRAGLVDRPRVFAHNLLEIAVAPGNPKHIDALADLARPGLKVVLADASVPAGKFARIALAKAKVNVRPVSNPLDVAATLQTVALGEADAAIVYVTDVRAAAGTVSGVAIPAADNVVATYPIAVVKASTNQAAARAFVDAVVSGPGRRQLSAAGFLGP
jgi:molybdate transport system substrate-binding protein